MDNSDFKQQFTQDVKTNTYPIVNQDGKQNLWLLVAMITVIVVVIIQLIVSAITLIQISSLSQTEETEPLETSYSQPVEEYAQQYDDQDYLTALGATCIDSQGIRYNLTEDHNYQKINADSTMVSTGTYSILHGSVFNFTNSATEEKTTLFYDGYALTDGTTFYECEATMVEPSQDES